MRFLCNSLRHLLSTEDDDDDDDDEKEEEEEDNKNDVLAKRVFNRFRSTSFATDATPKR
jgi:hypothetical protein